MADPADEQPPTREVYGSLDPAFVEQFRRQTGNSVDVRQSHGGSGRQARNVIEGLAKANVVSLALISGVDTLAKRGLIAADWRNRLPNGSVSTTSTIVFVVRRDNPKGIHDWPDLVKDGEAVVTPDPRTSGNGQLSFLAAWGSVTTRGGSAAQALDYLRALHRHVAVFDAGARSSATSFAAQQIGDVHADRLPNLALFPITAIAKDWSDARLKFFTDNGIYDVVAASTPAAAARNVPIAQGS